MPADCHLSIPFLLCKHALLNPFCRLENISTLAAHVHALFDRLDLWLEEWYTVARTRTRIQHKYRVREDPASIRPFPPAVTFTSGESLSLPLPSPRYLDIPAACCNLAWLSGVINCIETTF
ncbi:hypothetical protein BDR07DRAFT_342240 [Suillus spraguei]|nr:hypothetical protein BDR07DRAFT_342240 [Suillus spraguei]